MKYKVLYIFLFVNLILSFVSCNGHGSAPISKDDMISLLVDVHIAESTMRRQQAIPITLIEKNRYYKSVLDKHGVTEAEFDSAVSWYGRNTEEFQEVYKAVEDTLEHRMATLH